MSPHRNPDNSRDAHCRRIQKVRTTPASRTVGGMVAIKPPAFNDDICPSVAEGIAAASVGKRPVNIRTEQIHGVPAGVADDMPDGEDVTRQDRRADSMIVSGSPVDGEMSERPAGARHSSDQDTLDSAVQFTVAERQVEHSAAPPKPQQPFRNIQ